MSPEELSERNKRMKRAIDLSLKHTYLAHDVQKAEGTPFVGYLELEEVSQPLCLHSSKVPSGHPRCTAFMPLLLTLTLL